MFNVNDQKVFFRGDFVDFKDANVSVANTTFLYGLGVFTGMRAHWNEDEEQLYIFRPEPHYKRFYNSSKFAKFHNFVENIDYEKFKEIIVQLLKINKIKQDTYIRVSNYISENGIGPKLGNYQDDFCLYLYPLGDYVPTEGMKCKVSSWTRISDNSIPARMKVNGAYVNTAIAKSEALYDGYDEAIVLDENSHVVEGSAENIFIVRDGKIITPGMHGDILEGITRATVIQIAMDKGYELIERSIDRTELYFADEVFLTGTGAKVSPVTQIDSYKIGDGKVGKISKVIQGIYFDAVKGKIDKYKNWVEAVY